MHPDLDIHGITDSLSEKYKGKGFGGRSLIGPLDVPDAEGCLVLLLPVECDTFTAFAVPGAFLVGTGAVLRDKTVLAHGCEVGYRRYIGWSPPSEIRIPLLP